MPILSIEFGVFFVLFLWVYWAFNKKPRWQNILISFASLGWLASINYTSLLAVFLFASWIAVVVRQLVRSKSCKKLWLWIGIISTLLLLCFFKYNNFFVADLQRLLGRSDFDLLMPLGISYYCFQAIAYLSYTCKASPEQSKVLGWWDTVSYLSFFTTITTGPIFRADRLLLEPHLVHSLRAQGLKTTSGGKEKIIFPGAIEQFTQTTPRELIQPVLALGYVLLGIFKVWVLSSFLADNVVDPVFENPLQYNTIEVLTGIYGYTAQLYCNFSGSIDMVIGIAMLLGFQLPPNFAMPFTAVNLRDFWDRWHITLSTWIRDYIYIPLGGSRHGFLRMEICLIVAMILSGIWHGSTANFAVWGALHGVALALLNVGDFLLGKGENRLKEGRKKALHTHGWGRPIAQFFTLQFVTFAFVVFNTTSLDDAFLIFESLSNYGTPTLNVFTVTMIAMVCIVVFYKYFAMVFDGLVVLLTKLPVYLLPLPIAFMLFVIISLAPSGIPSFIYANF